MVKKINDIESEAKKILGKDMLETARAGWFEELDQYKTLTLECYIWIPYPLPYVL